MNIRDPRIRRAGSASLGLTGLALLAGAALSPAQAGCLFHSPGIAALLGALCCGSAVLLHPEIGAGMVLGFREFRKAAHEVARENTRR